MEEDRRKEPRRDSDKVLRKVLEILRVVEKLSRGEDTDFTESYADLVGLKDQLGRRREDKELGEALCVTIGSIASNIIRARIPEVQGQGDTRGRRKVRLIRRGGGSGRIETVLEGWEQLPPQVGRSYVLLQENGRFVRTSSLTRVSGNFLQTRNSLYEIEVLNEESVPKINLPPRG